MAPAPWPNLTIKKILPSSIVNDNNIIGNIKGSALIKGNHNKMFNDKLNIMHMCKRMGVEATNEGKLKKKFPREWF